MKNTKSTILSLALAALAPLTFAQDAPAAAPAPATAPAAAPSPEEVKTVFSYLLGQQFGNQLAMDANTLQASDFDQAIFFKGVADGLANQVDPEMRKKDVAACMQAFMAGLQQRADKVAAANLEKGKAFLAENAKKEGVVTTKSGLQYKVLTAGKGRKYDEKKDGKAAVASITYEGRLLDGTVFDASATPVDMPVNQVIPGFAEALKLMPIGSEWEVYIPSDLAYADKGPGVIGNNATLIFKLKLVDMKAGRGTQANPYELTPEILQQIEQSGLQPVSAGN